MGKSDDGQSSSSTNGSISQTDLLAELRRVATQLDKTPSMREMAVDGDYSPSTYQSRFGSWNDAVRAAGFTPNTSSAVTYSDEELLDNLSELAQRIGRTPNRSDMRTDGRHSPTTYDDRFGSWVAALEAAGLQPHRRGWKASKDDLIAAIEELADSLGRTPTAAEMADSGSFSPSTYHCHFGSWTAAVDAAGLSPVSTTSNNLSDRELLDEINRMTDTLYRPPTTTEMNELGKYSAATYRRRFGGWDDALRKAGVESGENRQIQTNQLSERALLDELHALEAELGRSPTAQDMWKRGNHSPATYVNRYGTWNAALTAAGLSERRTRKDGISTRELIIELRSLVASRNCLPQRRQMDIRGAFSGTTYYNRFGSWQQALEAAGITADAQTGSPAVQGFCAICCEMGSYPPSQVTADGKLCCDHHCEKVLDTGRIVFERDIVAGTEQDESPLRRFARLLREKEWYVPDVLLYLRYSVDFIGAGFETAACNGAEITQQDETVVVASTETFQVDTETLTKLREKFPR